ncbi:MAG: 2-C-methyl-D-erythritol 4-phosphate cytidylyltransferase [Anaerococcus sp.]|nr:2-C-methyl-D-erythritol 4-phosphate cytidylyltransferase [Anaerococcus sp.]
MIDGKFISLILTAAGSGTRMKSRVNKPYIRLGSKPIIEFSLDTISSIEEIDEIILVRRSLDDKYLREILPKYKKKIKLVEGKDTREKSTFEGLKALDKRCKFVLTHDGVRPFASKELFYRLIDSLRDNKAVITGVKSKDTVKIVDENMYIDFTPNRDYVYNIQTPQGFDKDMLYSLYEKYMESEFKVTDDSGLFEFYKTASKVKLIQGEYSNIKLTTKEDIIFAKAFIKGE